MKLVLGKFKKVSTFLMLKYISDENIFYAGFLISYFFFFVWPIFFSRLEMLFPQYIPYINPIGYDLKQMLSYAESWKILNDTPYIGANLYPPLTTILFSPLLSLKYSKAYKLITLITFLCFMVISYLIPLMINKKNKLSTPSLLVLTTGLISYGFQFELERGQFNIIAMTFSLVAIYIFHNFPKFRFLSYFMFSISVQLKVYPLIFILLFIDNWKSIKTIIIRFTLLGLVNFAALFILGPKVFLDFFSAIKKQTVNPDIWIGNHSIHSYISILGQSLSAKGFKWLSTNSEFFISFILIFIIAFILLSLYNSYKNKISGFNSNLLLVCTIGALLIPSVSHDYKLPILIAPLIIYLNSKECPFLQRKTSNSKNFFVLLFTFIFSVAHSSTLFSFTNKPIGLQNNFPALLMLFILIIGNQLVSRKRVNQDQEYSH